MSLTDDLMDMSNPEVPKPRKPEPESRLVAIMIFLPWIAWIITLTALMLVVFKK